MSARGWMMRTSVDLMRAFAGTGVEGGESPRSNQAGTVTFAQRCAIRRMGADIGHYVGVAALTLTAGCFPESPGPAVDTLDGFSRPGPCEPECDYLDTACTSGECVDGECRVIRLDALSCNDGLGCMGFPRFGGHFSKLLSA